ncbi:hypothetical protein I6E84_02250 [Psychrobacter sp. SCQQ22]|uniref:hypothetical protein n=1 Tax=Psychrobacter sp. SCQQ22 TaxID=2792059 RepID=UPI0018CD9154|nr:hypothetical protein [Psychrobacter sp. SCQQ22]MBH0085038.1 hypothetical protein [Psychrobacter sp. SCQQ22]
MNDFWQELIISWGGNAVLVGLITYIGKIYLERTGREEQAVIDERLKRLEQDHEKLLTEGERFHQISQQTYQKLFDEKINAAKELSILVANFEEHILLDEALPGSFNSTFFSRYLKICKYICQNNLFFSSALVRTNLKLYIDMKEELQQYYIDKNYAHTDECNGYLFDMEIREVQKFDELYDKHENDITQLVEIANGELEQIASVIDISLNTHTP